MRIFEIVTSEKLHDVFRGSNFGGIRTRRELLRNGLLKVATGYYTGHTIGMIMIELKLKTPSQNKLTKKGKEYLYLAFEDGADV